MSTPRALLILTENHTLVPPGDFEGLLTMAMIAEDAGFDAVMLSEHVVLGPAAGALGRPMNPRMYAAPGNQDPEMEWPSSIVMASAVAAATSRIRIVLGAVIAPLRHPVQLAKDLATLDQLSAGRLVVQPTVSWHRDEYEALQVPFTTRGRLLDEQLLVMTALWNDSPASFDGEFFSFSDVYCEPKPYRTHRGLRRPTMWFGGQSMHEPLLRRLVAYGDGFHPFGTPTHDDVATLSTGLLAADRKLSDLEMIGGTRATFSTPDDLADIHTSMADFDQQYAQGYATFCMKPSQHTDRLTELPALCEAMVSRLEELA